jgi:hypothetical protein
VEQYEEIPYKVRLREDFDVSVGNLI